MKKIRVRLIINFCQDGIVFEVTIENVNLREGDTRRFFLSLGEAWKVYEARKELH